MSKFGIVNVRMVITDEKILSNIDKVQKLINPKSKKKIIELEEDTYFKDLVESIKSYLIEYPKKNNFPVNVYKATYGLVEFATKQFEENTKKIETLIKKREQNIGLAGELKEAIEAIETREEGWREKAKNIKEKFTDDIVENIEIIETARSKKTQTYTDAMKILNAKVNNLESNLHIEIDMERLEDSSKALSYIGIEVADALKLIPAPEEQLEAVAEKNAMDEKVQTENIEESSIDEKDLSETAIEEIDDNTIEEEKQQYIEETTFEAKPSIWQRFKKSKLVRAATYIFRIKIKIELPSNALPEGRGEN